MNHSTTRRSLLACSLAFCSVLAVCAPPTVFAQEIHTSTVLHSDSYCDHVISLVHRYGVNNSFDRTRSMLRHSPYGGMVIPDNELGDLEIMQVTRIAHADESCGPKFSILIQNSSKRNVCDFSVSLVAVFGHICSTSPCTTVKVEQINPCETLEVLVQLPIEALAMGNRDGQVIGFQKLVVAIDSFDELIETNEANNIKAYVAAKIPFVAPAVVEEVGEAVSGSVAETGVVQSAPIASGPGAPVEAISSAQPGQSVPEQSVRADSSPALTDSAPPPNDATADEGSDELRSAIQRFGNNESGDEISTNAP